MLTITALPDGSEQELLCLGTLCPLSDEPSKGVCLAKKIAVERVGSYKKKLHTPIYRRDTMSRIAVTDPNRSFASTHCLGAVCSGVSMEPRGYVVRNCGAHRFCLQVYDLQNISSAFYRIAGYMITEDGFVAVAKRRTLLWCTLGFCAAAVFVLSYLILQYGAEGAFNELMRFGGFILP